MEKEPKYSGGSYGNGGNNSGAGGSQNYNSKGSSSGKKNQNTNKGQKNSGNTNNRNTRRKKSYGTNNGYAGNTSGKSSNPFRKLIDSVPDVKALIELILALASLAGVLVAGVQWLFYLVPHVHVDYELQSMYSCDVEGIDDHCIYLTPDEPSSWIQMDIGNNSGEKIRFDEYDGVQAELVRYIPYDELVIKNEAGGADWEIPVGWTAELGTQSGTYYASPKDMDQEGAAYSIEANDTGRFLLYLAPQKAGYYEVAVHLKYRYKGSFKSLQSPQTYHFVMDPAYEKADKGEYTERTPDETANKERGVLESIHTRVQNLFSGISASFSSPGPEKEFFLIRIVKGIFRTIQHLIQFVMETVNIVITEIRLLVTSILTKVFEITGNLLPFQ